MQQLFALSVLLTFFGAPHTARGASAAELLENGIDLDEHTRLHSVADAKKALGIDPRQLLIGGVGRLSAEKGFNVRPRSTAS